MLLVNFALNSLLCLNLHSHYLHIKNITWMTMTLQIPQQNYLAQNIPTFQEPINQIFLVIWVYISPKYFWPCYAIKIQVLSSFKKQIISIHISSFFFFPANKLVNQLVCSGALFLSRYTLPITKPLILSKMQNRIQIWLPYGRTIVSTVMTCFLFPFFFLP